MHERAGTCGRPDPAARSIQVVSTMAGRGRYPRKADRVELAHQGAGASLPLLGACGAERRAFEWLPPRLVCRYRDRWVAIHGGRIAGSARDAESLIERMAEKFGGEVFFVGYVGGQP